jgi:flagellar biogenesis protein FliO
VTVVALLQDAPPPPPAPGGYGLFLFETLVILVGVCLLAYAVVRFGLRRLYDVGPMARGPLKVLARLPLEPRRSVYIIEAAGKTLLIGTSESGPMTVLGELDDEAVAQALAQLPRQRSFLEILSAKKRDAG